MSSCRFLLRGLPGGCGQKMGLAGVREVEPRQTLQVSELPCGSLRSGKSCPENCRMKTQMSAATAGPACPIHQRRIWASPSADLTPFKLTARRMRVVMLE